VRMKRKGRLLLVLGIVFLVLAWGIAWSQVTERVSVDLAGVQGNGDSNSPSISADGKSVTFKSDAFNLVAGDTNTAPDIFVDDLQAAAGGGGGGGSSSGGGGCFISTAADGSVVTGEK